MYQFAELQKSEIQTTKFNDTKYSGYYMGESRFLNEDSVKELRFLVQILMQYIYFEYLILGETLHTVLSPLLLC